jgi:hypothetical protein
VFYLQIGVQQPGEFVLRKLVAGIAFVAVLALPATALAQPRWYRGAKPEVTI